MRYMYLILLTLLSVSAHAQAPTQDRFLDIEELTTPTGINVWLVEDHNVPVISLKFAFKGAGAVLAPKDKQGLVQLLSNTMDEGAGDYDAQSFQKTLADNSISLSFSSGRDSFSGSLKTLTATKPLATKLLNVALTQPRFDKEPVERMRQANMSRIKQNMSSPDWITARLMNDVAYEGHPYALNSGGTLSTLANITSQDLKNFVDENLTLDRLYVSIAGDVTKAQASDMVDAIFSSLPKNAKTQEDLTLTIKNQGKTYLHERPVPQASISIMLPSVRKTDPDYYAARIMNHIYGGSGFGSRLMETIREKEGLTYGIYSGLFEMDWTQGLSISTSTRNETVPKMLDLIKQEATTLKNTPISEDELQDAKDYILGSMPLSLTSTGALASIMLSLQLDDRPSTYLDNIDQYINAVTINDVNNVANKLLDLDQAITVIVGDPQNLNQDQVTKITTLPNVE